MSAVVIDKWDRWQHFHMAQCIARLRLETKGMTSRVSTLTVVRKIYGVTARTKAGALREMEDLYLRTYGWAYGTTPQQDAQGGEECAPSA